MLLGIDRLRICSSSDTEEKLDSRDGDLECEDTMDIDGDCTVKQDKLITPCGGHQYVARGAV